MIKLTHWQSNGLHFDDVIDPNFEYKKKDGILLVRFFTEDKYVDVDHCSDDNGIVLVVTPYIDQLSIMEVEDLDEFFQHELYYRAEISIPCSSSVVHITPLKHEYRVAIIPHDKVFDIKNMTKCTVNEKP